MDPAMVSGRIKGVRAYKKYGANTTSITIARAEPAVPMSAPSLMLLAEKAAKRHATGGTKKGNAGNKKIEAPVSKQARRSRNAPFKSVFDALFHYLTW